MLNSWKDQLEGFVASAGERTPTELINGIRDIGVAMGHDAGEALLNSHPELFAYRPMLTRTFIEMVHAQDVAEIRQMLEVRQPASFGQIAAKETTIGVMSSKDAYKRLDEVFEHVDFSRCTNAVMVGCGGRPFTMFRIHDQTPVSEIIGLDVVADAVETANILAAKLGYARCHAECCNGRDYDYRDAQVIYVASMVSPKSEVVSRIANTAPPDLQLVLWEPYSLARLWSERAEETLDPRLEVVGRTRVSRNMTRDVFVRFRSGAAGRPSEG